MPRALGAFFLALSAALLLGSGPTARGESGGAPSARGPTRRISVEIRGMACPFCAYGLEKQLRKLPGVEEVEIDVAEARAVLTVRGAGPADSDLRAAVQKAGFTPGRIERPPPK